MDLLAIVGGGIAVYGALLSTWVAVQQRRQTRYEAERLASVRAIPDSILDHDGQPETFTISVRAVNERPRPIQIDYGGFSDIDGERLYLDPLLRGGTPLPATLQDGEGCTIHFDRKDVMFAHTSVAKLDGVWVMDASGRLWVGPISESAKRTMEPDPRLPSDRWIFGAECTAEPPSLSSELGSAGH